MSYTKGDWQLWSIEISSNTTGFFLSNEGQVSIMSGGKDDENARRVCQVDAQREDVKKKDLWREADDERLANARLISAAPLLFEALTGKEEVPQLYAISWLGTLLRMCNKEKVYESLCKDAEGDFDSVNTMLKELKWLEENGTAAIKKAVGL